jgi:glycerol uptake facilitator-like aquaporin
LLAGVVGSGIMAAKLAGGNGALALLCNTLPTGAILSVLILTFGPLSGAHFNLAVSIAFALRRQLPWPEAATYIVVQIIGGVTGVWAAHVMFGAAAVASFGHGAYWSRTNGSPSSSPPLGSWARSWAVSRARLLLFPTRSDSTLPRLIGLPHLRRSRTRQ